MITYRAVWLCSLLLVLFAAAFAGDNRIEWRSISQAELQMKSPLVEPEADAEAIFWDTWIDNGDSEKLILLHYVRVKVFTERGRERYSKFDIPYFQGLKIKDLEARVIRPDGSIVEIGKDDIFEREITKAGGITIKSKSFAVPNAESGVIVEYRYKEVREYATARGMKLEFQHDIPVQTLTYHYKPYGKAEPMYQSYNFSDTKFTKDSGGYYIAKRQNVPGFREEPLMPPLDTVRPWMLLMGDQEFNLGGVLSVRIRDTTDPTAYWGRYVYSYGSYTAAMNKPTEDFQKLAADLTRDAKTDDEKITRIYDYCQKQIKNTSYDLTVTDEDRKKIHDAHGISAMLAVKMASPFYIDVIFGALASAAGFETRLTFTPNRNETFFEPRMVNSALIRFAATGVKFGQEWKYFHPGNPFLPVGRLTWFEDGGWALLVGESGYTWRQIPMSDYKGSVTRRTGKFKLSDDGTLDGEIRIETEGQQAATYRGENYDESADKREQLLRNSIKNRISAAEVSEVKIENINDISKALVQTYKVHVPGYAQRTGKRLFLQPGFFEYGIAPLFSSETRSYDVYFHYAWSEIDLITIELPKGFELDNPDTPGELSDPAKIGMDEIRMSIDKEHGILKYSRKFYFGNGGSILFPVTGYPALKKLFDAFQQADNHTITLKQS